MAQYIHYLQSGVGFDYEEASLWDNLNQLEFKSGHFQCCNQASTAAFKD